MSTIDTAQRIAELEGALDKLRYEHHTVRADAQARVDAAVIRALAAEKECDELRTLLEQGKTLARIAVTAAYLFERWADKGAIPRYSGVIDGLRSGRKHTGAQA